MAKYFSLLPIFCILLYACSTSKTAVQKPQVLVVHDTIHDTIYIVKSSRVVPPEVSGGLFVKNKELQEKYAALLHVAPDSINIKLYSFIDDWLHTPYKWGGTDRTGIDCSAFTQRLFDEVYGLQIPRTSEEQVYSDRVQVFTAKKYLAEGDIVFFRTMEGKLVSHVGFYLFNNMFVAASSTKGVDIFNLTDTYWKNSYVTAARVRVHKARKNANSITMR